MTHYKKENRSHLQSYLVLLAREVLGVFQLRLGRRLVPRRVDGHAVRAHARHRVVVLGHYK